MHCWGDQRNRLTAPYFDKGIGEWFTCGNIQDSNIQNELDTTSEEGDDQER